MLHTVFDTHLMFILPTRFALLGCCRRKTLSRSLTSQGPPICQIWWAKVKPFSSYHCDKTCCRQTDGRTDGHMDTWTIPFRPVDRRVKGINAYNERTGVDWTLLQVSSMVDIYRCPCWYIQDFLYPVYPRVIAHLRFCCVVATCYSCPFAIFFVWLPRAIHM